MPISPKIDEAKAAFKRDLSTNFTDVDNRLITEYALTLIARSPEPQAAIQAYQCWIAGQIDLDRSADDLLLM